MTGMSLKERIANIINPVDRRELFAGITDIDIGRRAIVPEWYFAAPYGQPRKADISEIREMAKQPFIHLCVKNIIDDFATTPWRIVPKDKKKIDETHIEELTKFYSRPNKNKETTSDLMRQWAYDVLTIDAGVMVKVFSDDSYLDYKGTKTIENKYDGKGGIRKSSEKELSEVCKGFRPLKPPGQRKLKELYIRDGSIFLPDADYAGFVHRYFMYSYRFPARTPTAFDRNEIVYTMMSPRSYSFYGWSVIQSLEDVIRTLKEAILYSLTGFTEKGVPEGIISTLGISKTELDRLKEYWTREIRGKHHKFAVLGTEAKFVPISVTAKDMEVIASQQWFIRLIMASFNIDIPVLSLKGEAPRAGTWALMRRERQKAVMPLLQLFAYEQNAEVIPEFGYDDVEFQFETYDMEEDQVKREMDRADVAAGILTINEVRTKSMGLDEVEWGDRPFSNMPSFSFPMPGAAGEGDGHGSGPAEEDDEEDGKCARPKLLKAKMKAKATKQPHDEYSDMDTKKFIGWDFSITMKWMLRFLAAYNFPQIKDVTDAQKKAIKRLLIDSLTNGWMMSKLEDELEEIVGDENKAVMIARTETIRAANEGALLQYGEENVEKVRWLATPSAPGGRTCRQCLGMNGKIFKLADASGLIPFHVNCRCTYLPVVTNQ